MQILRLRGFAASLRMTISKRADEMRVLRYAQNDGKGKGKGKGKRKDKGKAKSDAECRWLCFAQCKGMIFYG